MKILYAIQGTGNGHLARAQDVIRIIKKKADVDILISGTQADLNLNYPVKYRLHGLSFIFGKKGGVDIWKTLTNINFKKLYREISKLPVEKYDLVINDFEPISAWACKFKKITCISLSHQSAILNKNVPKPKTNDPIGYFILKYYAPASYHFSFHFSNYNNNIFTPVIREEIRTISKKDLGYFTIYLPSYSDEKLIETFSRFKNVKWEIFSKHNQKAFHYKNINIYPVSKTHFTESLSKCSGILCGAGFETPAEALFLGKKLMVIPMKKQLEQQYNAAALKKIGVPVINKLAPENYDTIEKWLNDNHQIKIDYPDTTEEIINKLFSYYSHKCISTPLDVKYQQFELDATI